MQAKMQEVELKAQQEAEKAERDSQMKRLEFTASMQMKELDIQGERERQAFAREQHDAEMARMDRQHQLKLTEMAAAAKAKAANANKPEARANG
jgi:hypothetical protein